MFADINLRPSMKVLTGTNARAQRHRAHVGGIRGKDTAAAIRIPCPR
jgi:hypothetical protein